MEKMPKIGKLSDVAHLVQHKTRFAGLDDDGNVVYDKYIALPTVEFTGTVKLHGTNGSVRLERDDTVTAYSKNNELSLEKDNAGFCKFVKEKETYFFSVLKTVADYVGTDDIYVYGEWCGPKIQGGVAISKLQEKSFFVFALKYYDKSAENYRWVFNPMMYLSMIENRNYNVYSIFSYPTYSINIDFENLPEVEKIIENLVNSVEEECPVGKYFGISGIGEGIVWSAEFRGEYLTFKSKGLKHRNATKPKKQKKVGENAALIHQFAVYAIPEWRLEQMFNETFDVLNGGKGDIKGLGKFIKAVIKDVEKEEQTELEELGLELKETTRAITELAKKWFFSKIG